MPVINGKDYTLLELRTRRIDITCQRYGEPIGQLVWNEAPTEDIPEKDIWTEEDCFGNIEPFEGADLQEFIDELHANNRRLVVCPPGSAFE